MAGRFVFTIVLWTLMCSSVMVYADSPPENAPIPAQLDAEEHKRIEVFRQVAPSVVFIKNSSYSWDLFSLDVDEIPMSAGSGFVWDTNGYVITNFHVVYQADKIEVVLADRKTYPAQVVGVSADHDIAVLKIDAPPGELHPIEVGSSQNLLIGQKTMVVGNPFGLDHSLSTGVVSALGRSITSMSGRKISDMIQTDAAINPGNSGGPLLDSSGKLIGATAAIYSPSGAYAGVGFAIPVDTIKRIVPQLIKYGRVKRLGIGVTLVPDQIRERLGLTGAMVLDVKAGTQADQAGIKPTSGDIFGNIVLGDVIVKIDGQEIQNNEDLLSIIENKHKAGDRIDLEIYRNGDIRKLNVALQEI